MKRSIIDFWVGLFAVLGAAAILFLALQVSSHGNLSPKATYTVTANFDNIGGLRVQAPVKSAGVLVGRVSKIQLDGKTYQAVVSVEIDKQYSFSSDSSMDILTSGLLGEQYIGIRTGAEEKTIAQTGKVTQTSSALVLEELINKMVFGKIGDTEKKN